VHRRIAWVTQPPIGLPVADRCEALGAPDVLERPEPSAERLLLLTVEVLAG
jgi:hypothetical protein